MLAAYDTKALDITHESPEAYVEHRCFLQFTALDAVLADEQVKGGNKQIAFSPKLLKACLSEAFPVLKSALSGIKRISFSNNLILASGTPSTSTAAQ